MKLRATTATAALTITAAACGEVDDNNNAAHQDDLGSLSAALAIPAADLDVTSVQYRVVAADASCDDGEALIERTVDLESESLPQYLLEEGAGDAHSFADAYFVLQPGSYRVCLTPLAEGGALSADCAPTEGEAEVFAESTQEVVLIAQCEGDPSGGLDVVAAFNQPPHIDDLV